MYRSFKKKSGFTLTELVITIAALAILASIAVPSVTSVMSQSGSVVCAANRALMERTCKEYMAQGNEPDLSQQGAGFLVSAGYFTDTPRCPSGGVFSWSKDADGIVHVTCSKHGSTDQSAVRTGSLSNDLIDKVLGSWMPITDGVLTNDASSHENRALWKNSAPGTNYTLHVKACIDRSSQITPGDSGYGVYYRATNSDGGKISGYCFQVDPGYQNEFLIRRVNNGIEESNPIFQKPFTAVKSFDPKNITDIQITVNGNNHTISVNGQTITDPNFTDGTYTAGGNVGFRTWNDTKANFYSMSVDAQ